MTPFRFPLEKVLHWRRVQLELEENELQRQAAALAELDRQRAELEAAAIRTEVQVREWSPLAGGDLAALAGFRVHVQQEERKLGERRAERQKQLDGQQQKMLEARRRCRLLERLRERRLADWRMASDRELEQFAGECYLAGVVRQRG
ncbi:MAG: hypothetical protein LAP40_26575 [Acidobacteriia bacterium]|nr:hypothetical protein [Terriglobia bacterium]